MAVYYKFKSAKDYDSISLDGHFISVAYLKEKIFETKHLGRGTDFDLVVTNAQTNEEYLDEGMLIPKNTSVLIRRVPGRPRMPIVTAPTNDQQEPEVVNKSEDANATKSSFLGPNLSVTKYPEDTEWDEFGNDLYAIPEAIPVQSSNQVPDAPPPSKADEDSKLRALIDTPALDWQHQTTDGFGTGRGFGRGMGGRMGGRGFGRGVGFERKTPPPGYVCHRCKIPGHFIQHCPTNGDPTFDVKRVKPPTGIPKSMLMATPDGSYALPSGAVAVLKPNEAAFEKEIEGMPSTRSVGDLPPELYCPLCSQVMKDAVLTSKCCFKSFCDKCIRDYIISKSTCICGATNVLADDLLPNKTLRDTICRILESNNSSGDNKGSTFHIQDMESKLHPEPKIPSPTLSAASKGEKVLPQNKDTPKLQDTEPVKIVDAPQPQDSDVMRTAKVPDVCEATHESRSVKEPAAQASAPVDEKELQQKPVSGEAGKKKKKKKTRPPSGEVQWRAPQEFVPENYMMPMGPSAYNPYWTGMQPGMEVFGGPFPGPMPYMGYGLGPVPMDVPYGGFFPQDPFGPPANMMPFPPQRDLAEYGMGFNGGPPVMSRGEFEARKADLTRKRDLEKRGGSRDIPKDREFSREVTSSSNVSSVKSKTKSIPLPSSLADREADFYSNRSERSPARNSRDLEPPRASSKRKVEYDHHYREELPHQHHYREELPHQHREELPYQHRETGPRTSSKRKPEYDHRYEEELPVHEHREKEHGHHHHHRDKEQNRHRSDTLPKPPVRPLTTDQPPRSTSINDHKKHKPSVFSRICFPEGEVAAAASSKKRKTSSSSNDHHEDHHKNKVATVVSKKSSGATLDDRYEYVAEYESSDDDDDRHFKRRPSRYEASEEGKHSSRVSKERERGSHSSKHSHSHR